MRVLIVLTILLVAGCQSQHPAVQRTAGALGSLSPVGSYEIERRHTFVLPFDASIYVVQPVKSLKLGNDDDVNLVLADKLRAGFAEDFEKVFLGLKRERLSRALVSARSMGAQFMVFAQADKWANIEPIKLRKCKRLPNDPKLCDPPPEISAADAVSDEQEDSTYRLKVAVYEAASGKLVDLATVRSQRGIAAYFYDDNEASLEALLAAVVDSFSQKQ